MQIGKLAKIAGCKVVTVRYYEKIGLLPQPQRTNANYRDYGQDAVERLCFIRHCRRHGMSLDEIGELIRLEESSAGDCRHVHGIISAHIANIDRQIAELESLKESLAAMLAKCGGDNARCAILADLRDGNVCAFCPNRGRGHDLGDAL